MEFCNKRIQSHLLNGGKIKRKIYDFMVFLNNNGSLCYLCDCAYCLNKEDLMADDWEIVKQEYNWDKIIQDEILCVFSDDKDFKDAVISTLHNVDEHYTANGILYKYCKPFNPADFHIAEDLKEYEK